MRSLWSATGLSQRCHVGGSRGFAVSAQQAVQEKYDVRRAPQRIERFAHTMQVAVQVAMEVAVVRTLLEAKGLGG